MREALEKDGWTITDDPLKLEYGNAELEVDLGAEKLMAAEKEGQRIAVEIKGFAQPSKVYQFHEALGQYLTYRRALRYNHEDRELFLAVSEDIYKNFFARQQMALDAIREDGMKLLVFNVEEKIIIQWIR